MSKYCQLCNKEIPYFEKGGYYAKTCQVCGLETCTDCSSGGLCKIHFNQISEEKGKKCKIIFQSLTVLPVILVIPFIILLLMYFWVPIIIFLFDTIPLYVVFILVFIFLFGIFGFPVWFLFTLIGFIRYHWIRHIWKKDTGIDLNTVTILKENKHDQSSNLNKVQKPRIKKSDLKSYKADTVTKTVSEDRFERAPIKFCPLCGIDNKSRKDICSNCGLALSEKISPFQENEVKDKPEMIKKDMITSLKLVTKSKQFIIGLSVMIFGIILSVFYFPAYFGLPYPSYNRFLGDMGFSLALFSVLILFIVCCSTDMSSSLNTNISIKSKEEKTQIEEKFIQGFKKYVLKGNLNFTKESPLQFQRLKEYSMKFQEYLKKEGLKFEFLKNAYGVPMLGIKLVEPPKTERQKELVYFLDLSRAIINMQRNTRTKIITYSLMVLLYGISIVIGIVMINEEMAIIITILTFILFFLTLSFLIKTNKYLSLAKATLGIPINYAQNSENIRRY